MPFTPLILEYKTTDQKFGCFALKMHEMNRWTIALFYLLYSFSSFAQITISGKIMAADSQAPLQGVNILGRNIDEGTISDSSGVFRLTTSANAIEITYIGYQPMIIDNLQDGATLFIQLQPSPYDITDGAPIIVRATPIPIELQIPAPLMNIPIQHLRRDDGVSIGPALNRVTGLLMHTGALNTNRITIRGVGNRSAFGTAKIRAYLDDIPLTSGVGETTIEDIDLSLLEKVQVWKGPTASVYGAGLGGMIHLKTQELQKQSSGFSLGTQWGSYGLNRQVAQLQYAPPGGKSAWALNYNRLHSDGYRDNNEYDREAFTLLGKAQTTKNDQFSLVANYTKLKAFIPSSLNRDDYLNEPQKAAFTWESIKGFEDNEKLLVGMGYSHDFLEEEAKELKMSSSFFSTFRTNYESRPFNILRENSFALGARLRLDYQCLHRPNSPRFSIGLENFREQYDWQIFETQDGLQGELLGDNQETRKYYNLFAELQWNLSEKWTLVSGLNFNETRYELSDLFLSNGDISGDYRFASILSPRLGLHYALQAKIALFGAVSHGFSPPTLEETLAPDGAINPEIQPEKGWNFEVGSRGRNLSGFSYELTFYSMFIRDLLVARRTALDQYVGVNAGKTVHNGIEVYGQYQLLHSSRYSLDLFLGYAYSDFRFEDFVDDEDDFSGNKLTGTAPHVLNTGVDFYPAENGFYGHLNYRFVDAMPLRDDNSAYSESYGVANLKAGYRYAFKSLELDFYGGINNLFDEKYAAMLLINAGSFGGSAPRYYYPGLPRNYYGGISLRYKL